MNSKLQLSAIQSILIFLFILIGWELLALVYTPHGDNWMWGQSLIIYCVFISALISVSNIISSSFNRRGESAALIFQIMVVITYLAFNFGQRPYRSIFIATFSIAAIVLGTYLMKWFFTKQTK
ncbi:hypothetical protein AWN68_02020 [Roseivirga echinicomitans]|uniref:Uncharacterized protein n=1 Tax=Roseivirga echinicomitans TaxID=296218 RepID=A0A150XXZ4_9BACT|nr:hypothetical protein AWN68_02020 [Roseivirga echinicomitans]